VLAAVVVAEVEVVEAIVAAAVEANVVAEAVKAVLVDSIFSSMDLYKTFSIRSVIIQSYSGYLLV
jgi:hypothetical protein